MIPTSDITGLVLAGGRGSRMGGVDKGLQTFRGAPMAMHTLLRLSPQVDHVLINANRNLAAYESFGVPVVVDSVPDFAGPLAGILAGLEQCQTRYLLTAPCDSPFVPTDLAARLSEAIEANDARIAMPVTTEPDAQGEPRRQVQPVFCLIDTLLADDLIAYLQGGGRKIESWAARHATVEVPFDDASAFANINTLEELHHLAGRR
ncbi:MULTISPECIES: molybdenum cofactor guanylyltransferase MobA [Ralstonia]|uniref:Molybdenum cofactor guanylyltransferase n=1 Tax=Ralstonia mannitolilytica TaxID=105219 RepID=A0AAJ4ZLW9_9RALS|nr:MULTISPECIES: molybdenum cofactor guanylyltransferase MobA [Ralstonia]AJW44906.1 molybdopterin-guanine dinucleotide biosynthesis protein A [Ralstonia mannitolilytica]MBU9578803.1 molybdenum cofactor guanylyltransferase MobA [Ralstonia mannitolilytica]PLT18655.1 molybdenum cofactor guanylyltransferase MobA [Ralstonia mannitolilytica]QIF07069.1 molybdenum cofactor guanylyltransferase MobA [Ralstonia mannitolilytica]CAG2136785.1 Molybdenum cofactor guanylyltransferase [Ralstonia mannitolilytic